MTLNAPSKMAETAPESPIKQTLRFFSSMQLGLALLLLLAVISAYASWQDMEQAIAHIYSSWWFVTVLSFVALNLLLCTIERFAPMLRLAFDPPKVMEAGEIRRLHSFRELMKSDAGHPLEYASRAFKRVGLRVAITESATGPVVFGERGRWGYLGSVVSHVSLIIILLGALYGVVTGFEVTNGGWVGSRFAVREANIVVDITDIRMVQEENPKVRPRVYSDLTVSRGGEVLLRDTVSINDPVRFGGNTIYHSTFIHFPVIKLTDLESGETGTSRFMEGDKIYLDAERTTFIHLKQFFPHFSMHPDGTPYNVDYRPERPVAAGLLMRGKEQGDVVFLPLNKAHVFETLDGRVEVVMTGHELAAVFSISKNLGRPFLFVGALLLIIGLYMSFFITPERYYAVLDSNNGALLIGGRGYRSRMGLGRTLEQIETNIRSERKQDV